MEFLVLKEVMEMAWWRWCFVAVALCSSTLTEWYLKSSAWSYTLGGWEFSARFTGHCIAGICSGIGIAKPVFGVLSNLIARRALITSEHHTTVNNTICVRDSVSEPSANADGVASALNRNTRVNLSGTEEVNGALDSERLSQNIAVDTYGEVIKEAVNLIRCDVDSLIFSIQTEDDIPRFHMKFWHKLCQIEACLSLVSRMNWFATTPFPSSVKRKKSLIVDALRELQEVQIAFYQKDQAKAEALRELEIERKKAKVERDARIEIEAKYKLETTALYQDLRRKLERFLDKAKEVLSDCGMDYAANSTPRPQTGTF